VAEQNASGLADSGHVGMIMCRAGASRLHSMEQASVALGTKTWVICSKTRKVYAY
jgi:hypothetical protein